MNRQVTAYLNKVCEQIKSKQKRLSTRAELMSHIQAAAEDLKRSGMDGEAAAAAALARMGDPVEIGRQIAAYNAPWQNILTTGIGSLLLAGLFVWLGAVRGVYLFDLAALGFVVLLTLAFVLIGGLSRLTRLSALARGRTAALYAGGIGVVIGIVQALGNIGDLSAFAVGLSFCITSALYGLLASAVLTSVGHLLRPLEAGDVRKILGFEEI